MLTARQIREAMSLSQRELGSASDLSDRTIRIFELGRLVPSLRTRRKLAAAYKVTLDQVDALARGEAVEWTGTAAAAGSSDFQRLQRDVEEVLAHRDFGDHGYIRDMCTEGEDSDILSRGRALIVPEWMADVRRGQNTPLVRERAEQAKVSAAA